MTNEITFAARPTWLCNILVIAWFYAMSTPGLRPAGAQPLLPQVHDTPIERAASIAIHADSKVHEFRIDLTRAASGETRRVRGETFYKVNEDADHYYSANNTWVLPPGLDGIGDLPHPMWGNQHGARPDIVALDLAVRYFVDPGDPAELFNTLGYVVTAKGKRVSAPRPGNGIGTGEEEIPEDWSSSAAGDAIEKFDSSSEWTDEVGAKKLYVGNGPVKIIGTTGAGDHFVTLPNGVKELKSYHYTYKIEVQGPGMAQPAEVIRDPNNSADPPRAQDTPRIHDTLAVWDTNARKPDGSHVYAPGQYTVTLTVTPTEVGGAGGTDTATVYIGEGEVKFEGAKTTEDNGKYTTRVCAGAVFDPNTGPDDVHTEDLTVTAKWATAPLNTQQLEFSFDNQGNDYSDADIKPPQFIDGGQLKSTLLKTTDTDGKVTHLIVLSSNLISKPALVVKWKGVEIGRVTLDCAAAVSRRGFALTEFGETLDQDTGWEVVLPPNTIDRNAANPPIPLEEMLSSPTDSLDFKVHLQFQKKLNDDGSWVNVSGHTLHISVREVIAKTRYGEDWVRPDSLEKFSDYVTLAGADGTGSVDKATSNGEAVVTVNASQLIYKCVWFGLGATDLTQFAKP